MVGGKIIEIRHDRADKVRLWCMDRDGDECAVYVKPGADGLPNLGDEIWWQSGKVYFNKDKSSAQKLGFSFDPRERT